MTDLFIITESADRTAAVIPENETHPVRREVFLTVLYKGCQRIGTDHASSAHILFQAEELAILYLINLVYR